MASKWKAGILTAALMLSPLSNIYAGPERWGRTGTITVTADFITCC